MESELADPKKVERFARQMIESGLVKIRPSPNKGLNNGQRRLMKLLRSGRGIHLKVAEAVKDEKDAKDLIEVLSDLHKAGKILSFTMEIVKPQKSTKPEGKS